MAEINKQNLFTLNLPHEMLDFLSSMTDFPCAIENFNSPEGMFPHIKSSESLVVIVVNADVLKNHGHNEVDKFMDLLHIDPMLGINPIVALTSGDEDYIGKILERGFAAEVVSINAGPKVASQRIKNITAVYQTRYEIEMDFLRRQEEQKRQEFQKLEEIDRDTGIFNRDAFCKKTEELIKNNPKSKFVLVRWDIDKFKVFNDTFGVPAGDELLKQIGQEYINQNYQSMTYGHWVSDHFVMCMEEKLFSGPAVHKMISKMLADFKSDFEFIVRMGVYRINDPNLSVRLMADRALLAIRSIKNDFEKRIAYYDDSMRGQLLQEQDLISDMETALKNKEFQIYFQPQYNYATGKMCGAEVLVRWQHPTKGFVSPAQFVPLFEQNGFICRLDEYVWERTCFSLRQWIDRGLKLVPVSVNISRRDIYNPSLCDYIIDLTRKYRIDPSLLRLEITESAYMEEPSQLIKVVEKLKSAGFVIEMDDFGSGYSSLNTLKDVPVDILKLDLKFLITERTNKRGGSILTSVVRMANWLKLPVIAEGIETVEQAEFLKSIGCYLMQGYLFSRPIPEKEFLSLMEAEDLELVEEDDISEDFNNTVDFLNPATQNALLFNSFVGGAAIVEYSKDSVEAIRINDKFFETVGITREDYANYRHSCLGSCSPEEEERFRKMLDETKSSGNESNCEIHYDPIKPGANPYWVRLRSRYLTAVGDSDIFYVAVENITERMNLYLKNEELAKELSIIMDNVPCGIIKLSEYKSVRKMQYANKTAAEIYGYEMDEFVELYNSGSYERFFCAGELEQEQKILREAISKKQTSCVTKLKIERKNGLKGSILQEGKIAYLPDGTVIITLILLPLNQQLEGDVTKFANTLRSLFDEILEVNYDEDKIKLIHSVYSKKATSKTLDMSSFFENWIKSYVAEKDRKSVARLMDRELVRETQANGEVPQVHFDLLLPKGETMKMTATLLQIDDSVYLFCSKASKE